MAAKNDQAIMLNNLGIFTLLSVSTVDIAADSRKMDTIMREQNL